MKLFEANQAHLGSAISIKIVTENLAAAESACMAAFSECKRIEQSYSRFLNNSDLNSLNQNLNKWISVSPELFNLIKYGEELKEFSGGAFNLSIKTVLESWGYDANYSLTDNNLPSTVGTIMLKPDDLKVKISAPIDLGGIGKGYALDQIKNKCSEFDNVFINAGGDLYTSGNNLDGKPWLVYLEHPQDPHQIIGKTSISNTFFGCSSPSKRKWREKHHLVCPASKEPANQMLAVYTQGNSGIATDGWATTLFAMGFDLASQKINKLPVEFLIVSPNGEMKKSDNFKISFFTSNEH